MKTAIAAAVFVSLALSPGADNPKFTDWSAPVNLGPVINTPYVDSCVTISKNGLSLFLSSTRQAPGTTNRDLYVSKRLTVTDPWGPPAPLATINTNTWESCPALSLDEHRLYFTSNRGGGCGGQDIWVSRRQDRRNDFGWEDPVNLGCAADGGPNTPFGDLTPALFEDEAGRVLMYFASNRGSSWDHYQTVMKGDDTFGPATPIPVLNSSYSEQGITVRRDGLEVIFLSDRLRSGGSLNFFTATRESTGDPWSEPVPVPSLGNPAWGQGKISLSFDGTELYFTSWLTNTGTHPDLFFARRAKVKGGK
jgi:WD40-like Beta Propeller Repeat